MPVNVVHNSEEEKLWEKAKKIAEQNGQKENWSYVMGIYKKMTKYEKKAPEDIYLTAADYKEFFEKYAAETSVKLAGKALEKIKGIPGKFKTEYDLGRPDTFKGKLKDIATFGGARRGNAALEYARYGNVQGEPNVNTEMLKGVIPDATIEKLRPIRKNSRRVQEDYAKLQDKINKGFSYEDGFNYDDPKLFAPEKVEEYLKRHANDKKVKEISKKPYEDQLLFVKGRLEGEKTIFNSNIDKMNKAVAYEKEPVDRYLADVKRARDNELAKSLGLWAVPTTGVALTGKAIYNKKHKE